MAAASSSGPGAARHNRMVWQNGTATEDVVVEVPLLHDGLPYTVPAALRGTTISVYARLIWEVKQAAPRPWLLYLQGESLQCQTWGLAHQFPLLMLPRRPRFPLWIETERMGDSIPS